MPWITVTYQGSLGRDGKLTTFVFVQAELDEKLKRFGVSKIHELKVDGVNKDIKSLFE